MLVVATAYSCDDAGVQNDDGAGDDVGDGDGVYDDDDDADDCDDDDDSYHLLHILDGFSGTDRVSAHAADGRHHVEWVHCHMPLRGSVFPCQTGPRSKFRSRRKTMCRSCKKLRGRGLGLG